MKASTRAGSRRRGITPCFSAQLREDGARGRAGVGWAVQGVPRITRM